MSIGERIAELRKQQNISQVQLAKALGVSRQAVSKWENDQTAPDTINLIRLADLLVTDTEFLATGIHATIKTPPAVVKVDNIVEKVVEKTIEIEKIVEVPQFVERVVERPVIRKVFRTKYIRNPLEFIVVGLICFVVGILVGILL